MICAGVDTEKIGPRKMFQIALLQFGCHGRQIEIYAASLKRERQAACRGRLVQEQETRTSG
jgi:hypothetical protein